MLDLDVKGLLAAVQERGNNYKAITAELCPRNISAA